jgi:hypothetical protein
MAQTSGTVFPADTVTWKANADSDLQWCQVLFTMSGTYDQSANSILTGVAAIIQNSRRNGKTVTMRYVSCADVARKQSNNAIMALKTVAISTNDVTFEITDGDYSTELAAGAIPAQSAPFSLLVGFTEA